jgi:hypothetical protein
MDRPAVIPLRVGAWCVDPRSGQISRDGEIVRVEARTMKLLVCLAERAGEVVSIDDLLDQVWSGVVVTPDSVYRAVASLRRIPGLRVPAATLRIAARLVRAADGYVVWSETYDRPLGDKLQVQADIAKEVAQELQALIH